jgi:galactose-1-phosphate uridylyltransferase
VADPLTRLPDGTIKQVNPFTGTKVWTVPGRGARPLVNHVRTPQPLDPADHDRRCAFCVGRMLDTTPEIARLVRTVAGWEEVRGLHAEELGSSVPEFRLVPNLFEILPYDYWRLAHGWTGGPDTTTRLADYVSTPLGREHIGRLVRGNLLARGVPEVRLEARFYEDDLADAIEFFAANHDVVIARRHFVDGATDDSQLAASGTLTPEEHRHYVRFTIEAARALYADNHAARYVAIFQNWLAPAGASFDHLHKQLVAIDELSEQTEREVARLEQEPDLYARWGPRYAAEQGLVVARTPSAVAFVGVGHRYPSLEVHSLEPSRCPWELSETQVHDFADLLHACHAATGVAVPTNEEWHHRPPSLQLPMPLRAVLKWRVSTLAGFEGGTKIYVTTLDPWTMGAEVVSRLRGLAATGRISSTVTIGRVTT